MTGTDLIMVCLGHPSGEVRGKAMPRQRFEAGRPRVGWTPTNAFIAALGSIAEAPYGLLGDRARTAFGDLFVGGCALCKRQEARDVAAMGPEAACARDGETY